MSVPGKTMETDFATKIQKLEPVAETSIGAAKFNATPDALHVLPAGFVKATAFSR